VNDAILLAPMTQAAFDAYIAQCIPGFAQDKVRAGSWPAEEALQKSREAFAKFLPEGRATPGHLLLELIEASTSLVVGNLWLFVDQAARPPRTFIYDIHIDENRQGHGLGRAAMALAEDEARRRGCAVIELHVFGWNRRAISLYEKAGYSYVDMLMSKRLA
jgi:ribosomal protein S18 acetylase RimI-like enzyme